MSPVSQSTDHTSTPVEVFTCGGCTWYVTDGLLTLQGGDGDPPCSGCAEIDLHNKSISAIHPDAFKFDTTSVEALDLAANNLGSQPMPDGIFAPLVNLERLFLSGNNLFDLPENIFKQNSRLTYLELYRQNARPFSGVSTTAFKTMMLKPVPDKPPLTTDIATVNISWVSCQFDFSPEFAELVSDRVVHTYSNPVPGGPPGYSNATFVGAARNWTFSSLPYNYFSLPPCATCLRGQFYTMDNKCMNCSTGNATCKYEVKPCNTFGDRVCSRFPPLWRRQVQPLLPIPKLSSLTQCRLFRS